MNFDKLPIWAQAHIKKIERERDIAVRTLNEYCATQTPGPFAFEEYVSTGELAGPSLKTRYVHAHHLELNYMGIRADISLSEEGIRFSYQTAKNVCGHVNCQPRSFQQFLLLPPPPIE